MFVLDLLFCAFILRGFWLAGNEVVDLLFRYVPALLQAVHARFPASAARGPRA